MNYKCQVEPWRYNMRRADDSLRNSLNSHQFALIREIRVSISFCSVLLQSGPVTRF